MMVDVVRIMPMPSKWCLTIQGDVKFSTIKTFDPLLSRLTKLVWECYFYVDKQFLLLKLHSVKHLGEDVVNARGDTYFKSLNLLNFEVRAPLS